MHSPTNNYNNDDLSTMSRGRRGVSVWDEVKRREPWMLSDNMYISRGWIAAVSPCCHSKHVCSDLNV